jgi:hypothetical protein
MAFAGGLMLPAMVSAAQANGALGGKATDKAKQPYSDYTVRVRGVNSVTVIQSVPLNAQGQFSFTGLQLGQGTSLSCSA